MHQKPCEGVEALQADLEAWLHLYNRERPYLGYRSQGRRSWDTVERFVRQEGIPLAKSGQAARAAKREVRVAVRGTDRSQSLKRPRLIAAVVATCCRCVLASPR
jgi:hypothetical protein